jgi:hypothetical protein
MGSRRGDVALETAFGEGVDVLLEEISEAGLARDEMSSVVSLDPRIIAQLSELDRTLLRSTKRTNLN